MFYQRTGVIYKKGSVYLVLAPLWVGNHRHASIDWVEDRNKATLFPQGIPSDYSSLVEGCKCLKVNEYRAIGYAYQEPAVLKHIQPGTTTLVNNKTGARFQVCLKYEGKVVATQTVDILDLADWSIEQSPD